jgi:hypothetical protein
MAKPQKAQLSKSALLLRDTYEIYAKMLAVENIKVVFDEAISAPAQFDILNRILYISPVHSAQAHLIPGLVIHEVGHALFSVLSDAEIKKLKSISKLLNIIDDGYQERMTCKKYAGAKKHLFTIFDEFFIKTGDGPYNTQNKLINIVNTLNYNCKGFKHGYYREYPKYVLPEDLELLRQGEMITEPSLMERNEFQKVLAKALKKYGEMPPEDTDLGQGKSGEPGEGGEQGDDAELMDDGEESDGGGDGDDNDSDDDDQDEDDQPKQKGNSSGKNSEKDPVEEELAKNSKMLNDHHDKIKQNMNKSSSYELPTGQELMDRSQVVDLYVKGGHVDTAMADVRNAQLAQKYAAVLKEAKRVAGRIVTKFNMRAAAKNYANAQFKKSGSLDPERCALYQVYDDVFIKNAIEDNQQNHAYSIMLDWSGSMDASIYALALRIMELTYFAKATGIEIEVWLYTTTGAVTPKANPPGNVAYCNSKFIKILNTKKCSPVELDQRVKQLWLLAHEIGSTTAPKIVGSDAANALRNHGTNGTNILEGIILGHHVLHQMEADVKTCFILSDGGDTYSFDNYWNGSKKRMDRSGHGGKIYVGGFDVDFLFNYGQTRTNATAALTDLWLSAGQRTTAIAWNTSGTPMTRYAQTVVEGKSPYTNKADYIHADNIFVDEIVKNLL